MKLQKEILFRILVVAGMVSVVAAAVTLIPNPLSITWNIFGYRSVCSFVPLSTIACLLVTVIVYAVQSRVFGSRRPGVSPFFGPALTAIILLALAGVAFPYWQKSRNDPASRMQKEIPESGYGLPPKTVPDDPDFPAPKTNSGKSNDRSDWIYSN